MNLVNLYYNIISQLKISTFLIFSVTNLLILLSYLSYIIDNFGRIILNGNELNLIKAITMFMLLVINFIVSICLCSLSVNILQSFKVFDKDRSKEALLKLKDGVHSKIYVVFMEYFCIAMSIIALFYFVEFQYKVVFISAIVLCIIASICNALFTYICKEYINIEIETKE